MRTSLTTAVATFATHEEARRAVDELRQAGFRADQIVFGPNGPEQPAAHADQGEGQGENVALGTAAGAAAGAGLGAAVGGLWAVGLAAGLLPPLGPAIAGGLLASVLASAAAGAAGGGLTGALIGLGLSEANARSCEREVSEGRVLVTVHAAGRFEEAQDLLRRCGGRTLADRPAPPAVPASLP
jgi:hypothetical protein